MKEPNMNKLFLLFFMMYFHPVHLTMMGIDFDQGKSVLNVFMKIYYDDFVTDSGFKGGEASETDFREDQKRSEDSLTKYIAEKVVISVNNKILSGTITSVTLSDNELNIRMQYKCDRNINTLMVRNLIMTSLYSDQSNMVLVKVNDFEEGVKLTPANTEKTFFFELNPENE